jgi:hypothetical protein
MPGDDGLGPDDDRARSPPWEAAKDERPDGPVPCRQRKVGWLRPEEDTELMAKGQVLGHEGGPRIEKSAEGAESESNEAEHRERIRSEGGRLRNPADQTKVQRAEGPTARPGRPYGILARHRVTVLGLLKFRCQHSKPYRLQAVALSFASSRRSRLWKPWKTLRVSHRSHIFYDDVFVHHVSGRYFTHSSVAQSSALPQRSSRSLARDEIRDRRRARGCPRGT